MGDCCVVFLLVSREFTVRRVGVRELMVQERRSRVRRTNEHQKMVNANESEMRKNNFPKKENRSQSELTLVPFRLYAPREHPHAAAAHRHSGWSTKS